MAGLFWNGWPECYGISGRDGVESVAGMLRNTHLGKVDAEEFENAAKLYGKDAQSARANLNKPTTPEQAAKIDKVIRARTRQAHAEIYRIVTGEEPVETERVRDSQGRLTGERQPVAEEPEKKTTGRKRYGEDAALERATELGIFDWMRSFSK